MSSAGVLVVDVGTSGVRAAVVRDDASVEHVHYREVLPTTPAPGFVEFDAAAMAAGALDVARAALADAGSVDAVGIANQRSSTIVWDRASGEPVGPGVGWQDLRTVGMCLALQAQGIRVAPNVSATKLAFLLDMADPERTRDLCFGTVDTWVAWALSQGSLHVTDLSNAAVTGMFRSDGSGWSEPTLEALRVPESVLPTVVDSSGVVGEATALAGSPPIAGIAGDQQASLIGQGCVRPGQAKITFGTGGMLDLTLGEQRPAFEMRGEAGCFPIVCWRIGGRITWGIEAFMLTAGQAVEWLRDDIGLISSSAESAEVAARCDNTGDVWFVPALLGMGTPAWDFGARGTLLGLTRGTGRPEVVRAVLEGVAHRGADLVEAAEADASLNIGPLRVDGGMSANDVFTQALADTTQRPVELSPVTEATTLGAAFLAGMAVGVWKDTEDVARAWSPRAVVEPARATDRARWYAARERAQGWVPELSSLDF
ncbi:MAG TPA: FGGY family carbohydrate kinase [Acidimicrobiales bacterium]|jgi:glycerol kinase|nr:FGGY family carbohydrate kinase [Acidimicrobiales bacterium]